MDVSQREIPFQRRSRRFLGGVFGLYQTEGYPVGIEMVRQLIVAFSQAYIWNFVRPEPFPPGKWTREALASDRGDCSALDSFLASPTD